MNRTFAHRPVLLLRTMVVLVLLYTSSAVSQELLPEVDTESMVPAVEKLIEAGRQALRAGDIEAAARAYSEALRLQPKTPKALYQMAIYYFRKQDYVRGFELIRKAIEVAPNNPFPRLALAKGLGEVGDFEAAIAQYQQILDMLDPDSRPAQAAALEMNLLKFRLATRDRDREQLQEIGDLLVSRYSNNPSVLELVANVYVRAGFYNQARDIYFSLLNMMPDNPQIEFYLGDLYEAMRDPEKAVIHYERAMDKGQGTPLEQSAHIRAAILKAILLLQQGEKDLAQQHFLEVLELDENNVIANMNAAAYFHEQRDFESARQAYQRVIERQPDNLEAHYRLAIVSLDMGDSVNGVRHLDYVLARAPDSPIGQAAQDTMGRVQQRFDVEVIRQVIADEQMLAQQLREDPDDPEALTAMGDVLLRQQRREQALEYFERAMQAAPNYGAAFVKAGRAYDEARQHAKAKEAYQRALALLSDDDKAAQIRERLVVVSGNLYLDDKEFEKAEENFQQAYQILRAKEDVDDVDLAEVLWGLAMSNAQQGDLEEAATWYEELIAVVPGHLGARINAAFVYEQLEEEEKASAHYNAVRLADNAPPAMRQRAEDRLDYIRRQTNGFSYIVGYVMGFDDNLNSARSNKFFEYRSDLFASAIYRYKLRKGMKLSVTVSPSYSIYHRAEFDFFNFTVSPDLLFEKWGYDWTVGMSRNSQSSVLRPEQSSTVTDTFSADASWLTDDKVGYRVGLDYRGFGSTQNPFFDANTYNLGLSANFAGPDNSFLSYGYSLTVNNNKNPLGSDYAYTGHGLNGRIDKRIDERLTGYISGRLGLNLYKNADSSTNFQRQRRTFSLGFGTGLTFRIDSWVSFFTSYNFTTQYANLPVGVILTEQQSAEVPERVRQSSSVGSFVRHSISVGIRMNF